MADSFRVLDEAELDIHEAFQWYEEQVLGRGVAFVGEVDTVMRMIGKNPDIGHEYEPGFDRFALEVHPYCLYFFKDEDMPVFAAVIDTYRKPATILKLLKERRK